MTPLVPRAEKMIASVLFHAAM